MILNCSSIFWWKNFPTVFTYQLSQHGLCCTLQKYFRFHNFSIPRIHTRNNFAQEKSKLNILPHTMINRNQKMLTPIYRVFLQISSQNCPSHKTAQPSYLLQTNSVFSIDLSISLVLQELHGHPPVKAYSPVYYLFS